MSIQILGLRPYQRRKDNKVLQRTVFFNRKYRADSVADILQNHAAILQHIPEEDHYNLFFTVANCHEEKERGLKEQWVIPFDIDDIHIEDEQRVEDAAREVFAAACEALELNQHQVGAIFSGHGVQLFVGLNKPIVSGDYFDQQRDNYKAACENITAKLKEKNLKGTVDPSVFSDSRLMRMPSTWNRKQGKPERKAIVISQNIEAVGFDLTSMGSGQDAPLVIEDTLRRYPTPDTKAVCEGCKFLQHCKDKPDEVSEPQWYAMLSITARLDDGENLSHTYSEGHKGYSHYETELKIRQALASSGPRTCKNIDFLWSGCKDCDNYGKVISPITIKGPDYIRSKDQGYRELRTDKNGNVTTGRPCYDDLIKEFEQQFIFRVVVDNRQVHTYNGTHWVEMLELEVKNWMYRLVVPSASAQEMSEFYNRVLVQNLVDTDWFHKNQEGKANFKNGTLHIKDNWELKPHSPDDGFTTVLPYDYDATAQAPKFETFLNEVMPSNEVATVVKEFLGYCISGDSCWLQKAMMLVGEGANGKSVLMETVAAVVGKGYYSSRPLQDLGTPIARMHLLNKFFNYSEETSYNALSDSSMFKNLVTGGIMEVKRLYHQPIEVENRAKLIFSTNEIPRLNDRSDGIYRRLIIVNMDKQFKGDRANPRLKQELLGELAGIFNLLMRHYIQVKERGTLSTSAELDKSLEEFKEYTNQVVQYISDCITVSDSTDDVNVVTKNGLYSSYRLWSTNNGYNPLNNVQFFKSMRKAVFQFDDREKLRLHANKRQRIITGLKLNEDY